MQDELRTDEYRISISREIQVCKNMIERQLKDIARFEKEYGLATERLLAGELPQGGVDAARLKAWRDDQAGLLAWQQRLREYEEAYAALRR